MTKKTDMQWRSRIVASGKKTADQFTHNPKNPKFHPVTQRDTLRGIIGDVGQVAPVIENVRTGYLVDGHERVWLALETNAEVDYIQIDVSEEEEAYILATLDPVGMMAQHDKDALDALLKEVNTGDAAVMEMLSALAANNGLIPPDNPRDEWVGMPEYEQESIIAFHTIKVHFKSQEDLEAFASLVNQTVTDKTTYIYYPPQIKEDLTKYRVLDES